MSDTVQPGTEIDKEVWDMLREHVRETHGVVRGNLKSELENAIRAYCGEDSPTSADVERRLARIEAAVGVEATDGGTDTSEPAEDTHTREPALDVPDERPHARGDTKPKVHWLGNAVLEHEGLPLDELSMIPEYTVREVIQDEYGFTEDTTEEYIPKVIDALGLVDHPSEDVLSVTEEKRQELIEKQREQARSDARETTRQLEGDE